MAIARVARGWRAAVLIVKPDTVLVWHRTAFRFYPRRKAKPRVAPRNRTGDATAALIRAMAADHRLWGAERIRGELLKLGIRVSKRTIQKYMRTARPSTPSRQRWLTFVQNHLDKTWAGDFVQTYDILFRPIFGFFIIHPGSRRVVHFNVTRQPTAAWTAPAGRQELFELFLHRRNERKLPGVGHLVPESRAAASGPVGQQEIQTLPR